MSKKNTNTRYFMIELVVNSIFFIFAAAVSLNLFVLGRAESVDSMNLSMATIEAQNVAETFKAIDGNTDELISFLNADKSEDGFMIYFDKEWMRTDSSNKVFELNVDIESSEKSEKASISVVSGNKIIFEIDVMKYVYSALR